MEARAPISPPARLSSNLVASSWRQTQGWRGLNEEEAERLGLGLVGPRRRCSHDDDNSICAA
ncbi:hypothetical protein E2562_009342 [Oryza meyeriana var. granulata]|uniref:Uncharacterized protein n=1 Tax=Oryza meyeriana var. granulata TaxID=110450 RepID=A0A6G1CF00_9ORYZ|nr:hypothetical protein E2562_009342 [Oryza meyeriana var. granulata]